MEQRLHLDWTQHVKLAVGPFATSTPMAAAAIYLALPEDTGYGRRRLQAVTPEHLPEIRHRSPRLPLWTAGDDGWLPVRRLRPPLFALDEFRT